MVARVTSFYGARRTLLRSRHRLHERGWDLLEAAFDADDELEVECAWIGGVLRRVPGG